MKFKVNMFISPQQNDVKELNSLDRRDVKRPQHLSLSKMPITYTGRSFCIESVCRTSSTTERE